MSKNAIGIRCKEIGDNEKRLYSLCKEYFGSENTFFVLNNEKKVHIPDGFNSVVFNENTILNAENLYWPKDVAWRCGDYCYYALWRSLSGYEYIWLIENDVKICTDDAKDFFSDYESSEYDFIAPFFGKAHEKLPFHGTAKFLEAEPYSCLFCVSRVRASIIPKLLNVRKKVSEKFKKERIAPQLYPNDEIFVATAGMRTGLRCAPLDKISSYDFSLFSSTEMAGFLDGDVENVRGKFVMHPVLQEDSFKNRKFRGFQTTLSKSNQLLDYVTQTIRKCPDEKMKKDLKKKFLEEFGTFLKSIR